jgi:hypothetical protein
MAIKRDMVLIVFCLALTLSPRIGSALVPASNCQTERWAKNPATRENAWRPAVYRGLVLGKSKRADMLRVFSKPKWSGPPLDELKNDPNPETWNEYDGGGEFAGKVTVVVNRHSGMISRIYLYPENLSKTEAVKHFGNDYVLTKYGFDSCLGDEESAPLYESPEGVIRFIEYRSRGIAIAPDYQDKIKEIDYVSGPIGAPASKCKPVEAR